MAAKKKKKKKMCSLFGQLPDILKECIIHQSLGPLTRISPPTLSIASTNGVNEGRLTPKDNQSVTVEAAGETEGVGGRGGGGRRGRIQQ